MRLPFSTEHFFSALVFVAGCYGQHDGLPPSLRVAQVQARIDCSCLEEGSYYETSEECLAVHDASLADPLCAQRAFALFADELTPRYECYLERADEAAACFEAAGCSAEERELCEDLLADAEALCPPPTGEQIDRMQASLASCQTGEPRSCPEVDLGRDVGPRFFESTTRFAGDDAADPTGDSGRPDETIAWQAPSAGRWWFEASGIGSSSVSLYVITGCGGPLRESAMRIGSSAVILDLAEGETVLLVVESRGHRAGPYALTIREEAM